MKSRHGRLRHLNRALSLIKLHLKATAVIVTAAPKIAACMELNMCVCVAWPIGF